MSESPSYRIADDGSYKVTYEAVRVATEHILMDWQHGFPGVLDCDHIFATLTMAEGYEDATVHSLAVNPAYRREIIRMQKLIINAIAEFGDTDV